MAQIVGAVRQAKPAMALLGTDAPAVSDAVEGCLATLSGDPVRIVRVRGLPGVPLTLSRIVEEIGAGHRNGPQADDDELIVRVLATRSRGEDQVVLLLEQAELLPLPTLVFLQVALTVFGVRTPRLQLAFAGHPRFMHLINRDELTPLRDRLGPVIRVQPLLAGLEEAVTPGRVRLGGTDEGRAVQGRPAAGPNRRQWVFVAVPALALAAAAAATVGRDWYGTAHMPVQAPSRAIPAPAGPPPPDTPLSEPALPPQAAEPEAPVPSREPDAAATPAPPAPPSRDDDAAAASPPQPLPAPSGREPDVAAAAPPSRADAVPPPTSPAPLSRDADAATAPPPPQPALPSREPDAPPPTLERRALPSSEQLARLRSDFDRFLSQTEWGSKKLSENERSRLFNEYLRWNYGTLAATPGSP